MKYYYRFTDKKRINARSIKMAQVSVYDLNDKLIGSYAWSNMPLNPKWNKHAEIENMVRILIKDYELRQIINI